MPFPAVFGVVIGLFAFSKCHQPLNEVTEISPIPSAPNITHNCDGLRQENERLKQEVESLKGRLEVIREMEEDESEESDDQVLHEQLTCLDACDCGPDVQGSCGFLCGNIIKQERTQSIGELSVTSRSSTSSRRRRGAKCDAGTLNAWACAPQCIFKLKGLCGLSLKTICHC